MTENIDGCPYCGGHAKIEATPNGDWWIIRCILCPAMMKGRREEEPRYQHFDQLDALIREWNRRYDND